MRLADDDNDDDVISLQFQAAGRWITVSGM